MTKAEKKAMRSADQNVWAANARKPYWRGLDARLLTPLHIAYMRFVDVAVEEARDTKEGLPTDEAVLAIDWLFRPADPKGDPCLYLMSIVNCAHVLDVDIRRLRGNIRLYLRTTGTSIYAAQVDQARLNRLLSEPLPDDEEELFDYPRAVFAIDQQSLFTPESIQ